MLEQSIEKIEGQLAKLITTIETLNEVLTADTTRSSVAKIMAVPHQQPDPFKAEEQPKTKPETANKTSSPTVVDVQQALIELAKAYDREAALSVLFSFNGAKKVGDLDKDQYAELIAAAANYTQQESA